MQAENESCYSDEIELDLDDDLELVQDMNIFLIKSLRQIHYVKG